MATSTEEFFTDTKFTDSNLRDGARLIHAFLSGGTTAIETAHELTTSFHAPGAADVSEVVEECIVSCAEQLPETHDQLVKLATAVRSLQEEQAGDFEPDEVEAEAEEHSGLATFDHALVYSLGERWLRYGDPDPADSFRDQARLEWFNLNHFAAALFCAAGGDRGQLADFGRQTLGFTLRRGGWRVNWKQPENTSDQVVALEGHAPAAAHWIRNCGRNLYNESESVRANWMKWLADLEWITGLELDEEIKSLCRHAYSEMQQIP